MLRGEPLVEGARLLVARADNASELAQEGLAVAMHVPAGTAFEVGEDIFRELPPLAATDDCEALVYEVIEQRVELKVLWKIAPGPRGAEKGPLGQRGAPTRWHRQSALRQPQPPVHPRGG